MNRLALLLLVVPLACSDDPVTGIATPAPDGGASIPAPSPSGIATSGPNGGAPRDGGPGDPTQPDPGPPKPGAGSGGSGGPGPGEHDVSLVGTSVALHVPTSATPGTPTPLLLLLHGQGDTGRNFLNVYMYKGLPKDLILAAPDANDDATALKLESQLKTMFDVDTKREYVLGFSQGGGYAAFLLFDAASANRFAAVALASSGLAENPAYIPAASPSSPGVAVVIDPADFNNTWGQGKTVMQDFVVQMQNKGYASKLWLHGEGHKLSPSATQDALAWMLSQTK